MYDVPLCNWIDTSDIRSLSVAADYSVLAENKYAFRYVSHHVSGYPSPYGILLIRHSLAKWMPPLNGALLNTSSGIRKSSLVNKSLVIDDLLLNAVCTARVRLSACYIDFGHVAIESHHPFHPSHALHILVTAFGDYIMYDCSMIVEVNDPTPIISRMPLHVYPDTAALITIEQWPRMTGEIYLPAVRQLDPRIRWCAIPSGRSHWECIIMMADEGGVCI